MQRLAPLLPKDCLKIFHIDVAHILFQNWAEANRLLAIQRRRGVTLRPRRFEVPNLGIEYADCATMLGNRFTEETFVYAKKDIYPVPVSTPVIYPAPEDKDFEACRRTFLWLGSGGLVRKGLDLALEAFAAMPDFRLIVCGPIDGEKDFERAYARELYELPNIHTVGWVDLSSAKFQDILQQCLAMIFPSSCEGQCCGVIGTMAGGLIPVVSYESGVDVHDFGTILKTSEVNEIKRAVRELSVRPAAELKSMALKAWRSARDHHSREAFAREWRRALHDILRAREERTEKSLATMVVAAS
jgi:glycosyltransferase involved in cell wall biosynthesis